MELTNEDKEQFKKQLVSCLSREREVKKIVVFGSFISSNNPNDIDIAVFQDSFEEYIPLAMKYRKKIREISRQIPIDNFPINMEVKNNYFLPAISNGEILYEE